MLHQQATKPPEEIAAHNKAVIGLSLAGGSVGGFQFLDLATKSFEPAFASQAPVLPGFSNEYPQSESEAGASDFRTSMSR